MTPFPPGGSPAATGSPGNGLDRRIPPEIRGDAFEGWIERVAATPGVRTILEIGASSGEGSTTALVAGALRNPERPEIHCLEVSRVRHAALSGRYRDRPFVHCHNLSSVPASRFPTEADVDAFRRRVWTRFRFIPRRTVMAWLRQDLDYLAASGLSVPGIRIVSQRVGVLHWDAVLIDGSEFTGPADLEEVYGARFLLLDDIRTFKNHDNARRLDRDPAYRRLARARRPRNGFAVYERRPDVDPATGSGA